MARRLSAPRSLAGPTDATLDAPPLETGLASPLAANVKPACPRVEVVEGSGPCLLSETQTVLRSRLRLAALALCAGFAAFLVWELIYLDILAHRDYQIIVVAHAVVMVSLGLAGASLCRGCTICTSRLRLYELMIFGLPAAFFVLVQSLRMHTCAWESAAFLQSVAGRDAPTWAPFASVWLPLGPWMLLIFTYALFIPNSGRRAAVVLGAIAAAPVMVMLVLALASPVCAAAIWREATLLTQNSLSIVVAAGTGVLAVKTIGALRTEAFEARQLGQYRLRHALGVGGMGEVYFAEHQLLKRPCAIKLIRPEKAGDPQALARFEREVQAAARLSHWHSIEIFDYGHTADGVFYYVMEYLPGLNLQELVDRYGPLPPERVIHFLRQTCAALAEAHGMGLLHRDIKPANIFAAHRGGIFDVTKLLDFGLVKPIAQSTASLDLTQEGAVTGSPLYMAPEQANGDGTDARTDIYALGCVAYFLLTGRPPFVNQKAIRVLMSHIHDAPAAPSTLQDGIGEDLEQIVLKCLAKSPADRFADVVALAAALATCSAADKWTEADASRWWNERHVNAPPPEPALIEA